MKITHINPDTMHKNPAYSQGVSVEGASKTIYVGGQNGLTAEGKLVGEDLKSQSVQALKNVLEVLKTAGATQENVVKLTMFFVQGSNIAEAFEASKEVWGMHATAITGVVVSGLAVPGALVEIEAIAAI